MSDFKVYDALRPLCQVPIQFNCGNIPSPQDAIAEVDLHYNQVMPIVRDIPGTPGQTPLEALDHMRDTAKKAITHYSGDLISMMERDMRQIEEYIKFA